MSGAPSEEEVPIYRAKTLTPESPRPLHIPSPANIPILEHQIDPIFNLMSTHTEQPQAQGHPAEGVTQEEREQLASQAAVTVTSTSTADMAMSEPATAQETFQAGEEDQNSKLLGSASLEDVAAAFQPTSEPAAEIFSSTDIQATGEDPALSATREFQDVAMQNDSYEQAQSSTQDAMSHVEDQPENATAQALESVANPDLQALMKSLQVPMPAASTAEQSSSSSAAAPGESQASPTGLPPRPPPQEKPSIHPNYEPGADIRSFHFPSTAASAASPSTTAPPPVGPLPGSNDPSAIPFQQGNAPGVDPVPAAGVSPATTAPTMGVANESSPEDIEKAWRTFTEEESVFTAEGAWEKFPHGSRLFVGNLPTESVSRREIFNIFYKYGKLAQISIKQAYGFVQFMDVESCQRAMKAEQGARIKERNMHLEISKPPKNNRGGNNNNNNNNNQNQSSGGERNRDRHRRDRSRSPGRRNRGSRGGNKNNNNSNNNNSSGNNNGESNNANNSDLRYSDFRDEPRRGRDDYRPGRSPSPRRGDGYRPRDRSSDRHYDGRRRSRSPYGRNGYGRRSPSPHRSGQEDDLPLPRRSPRDVPDVQIILIEDVSRPFVEYVVSGFQTKGIRCDVLNMPRAPLEAVIRRQIIEGVIAVCNLTRREERTGKVPLQVFDRSRGSNNVRFDEYEDLEMPVAAALCLRAKATNPPPTPTYGGSGSSSGGGGGGGGGSGPYVPPYLQQAAAAMAQQNPNANLQNLITSLDPATLQQLVGVVGQAPPSSATSSTPTQSGFPGQYGGHQNMEAILSALSPQQQQQQQQQQQDMQARSQAQLMQQREQQMRMQSGGGYPYSSQTPQQQQQAAYAYGTTPQQQQAQSPFAPGQSQTSNVQSIMEQLASIQRQG